MAGLGVAICSYHVLGIWINVGQTKQFLKFQSKKIKMQHNLATSRSKMCMGAKPPYPMESTTVAGNSTVLAIHLVKDSLYIWLEYCTLYHPETPSLTLLAIMLWAACLPTHYGDLQTKLAMTDLFFKVVAVEQLGAWVCAVQHIALNRSLIAWSLLSECLDHLIYRGSTGKDMEFQNERQCPDFCHGLSWAQHNGN